MLEGLDLGQIQEEQARELIIRLLNLIERLSADLREALAERTNDCAMKSPGSKAKKASLRSSPMRALATEIILLKENGKGRKPPPPSSKRPNRSGCGLIEKKP